MKTHPTFKSYFQRYFVVVFCICVPCFCFGFYYEYHDINNGIKNILYALFAAFVVSVFLYLYYLRFTVACPDCKVRLKILDSGYGKRSASAECPSCAEVYDLGVSFDGD
jgi:hypothetical protein